ncbi:MAG: restriction endonuclease subunit R, partial [Ignavibacteriota bacterium]
MPTPQIIRDLVETFDRNFEIHKKATNETQVRRQFIDPFFKALGWDIDNEGGAAPQYQDVVHEDQLKIKGSMKAPDYAFRIGGQKKFYVEAKKPSVYVKDDPAPAMQVRTYAWNAKLDLSIVTDFEEFAVYECSSKPKHGDKPNIGRVNYFTYKEYIDKWDEIAGIFSKDAVLKGSFDKYAAGSKGKRGTQTVDKAFLAEIEKWRELLAKNFAKNNKISEDELKFATQRTLDRIIFLRICESRGIEEEGRLQDAVSTLPSPLPLSRSTGRGVLAPSPGT